MIHEEIRNELLRHRDDAYRAFQSKLIPTVKPEAFIGVRTPLLRQYAKALSKRPEVEAFLRALPHASFDENQLHAFVICTIRDYDRCMAKVNAFLPFVDNWATCDQLSPKVFQKHKTALLAEIKGWLASERTYSVRFAVGMLMEHFLDDDFDLSYPALAASVRSEEYYVKMMVAWYFATALAKQYDAVLPFLQEQRLDVWTHNKAIQKGLESRRLSQAQKQSLRQLRIARTA